MSLDLNFIHWQIYTLVALRWVEWRQATTCSEPLVRIRRVIVHSVFGLDKSDSRLSLRDEQPVHLVDNFDSNLPQVTSISS